MEHKDSFRRPPSLQYNEQRGFLPQGWSWPGRKADNWPLSSAEEKNEWSCESIHPVWANFTFRVS